MEEIGRTAIKKERMEEHESYKFPTASVGGSQAAAEPPVNLVDLEERILQLCAENPKGISEEVIKSDQPQLDAERRLKALERLLTQVFRHGGFYLREMRVSCGTHIDVYFCVVWT